MNTSKKNNCLTKEEMVLYKKGQLDKLQRFRVEDHMLECELCSEASEGYESLSSKELQSSLETISAKFENAKKATEPKKITSFLPRIAATLILLIAVPIGLSLYQSEPKSIFDTNFTSNTFKTETTRSKNGEVSSYDLGVQAYNAKGYSTALNYFKNYANQKGNLNFNLEYKLGVTYLRVGNIELANEHLMNVRLNDPIQKEDATWYLALIAIKKGENKKAVTFLQELTTNDGYYHKKATALLKDIKKS